MTRCARNALNTTAFTLALLLGTMSIDAADFVVPLMPKLPALDGRIDAAEWAVSAGFDGFQYGGGLQQRRARGYVGATESHLLVAIASQLPDRGELSARVTTDSLKAVHDDSVEVYVCPLPGNADRVEYQFLVNSLGKGGYNIHVLGNAREDVAWKGNWQQAHGFHDGWWHLECAIPVASMVANRKTTEGLWAVNLTRNWKNPWEWSSLSGGYAHAGYPFRFVTTGAPAVQYSSERDPLPSNFDGVLQLYNPSESALPVTALLRLQRNRMPALLREEAVTIPPGEMQRLVLNVPQDDATTKFELHVAVTSADGAATYYERDTAWPKAEPLSWVVGEKKKVLPVDFRFAYYPYHNRMRIAADVRGLPAAAELQTLTAMIRDREDDAAVKTVEFLPDAFTDGTQERAVDLPPLDGRYEIVMKAEGPNVPEGEVVKRFERAVFPWEHTPTGRSTSVFPPFTPIELEGKQLRTVLREHVLNDVGLLDQVTAQSAHTGIAKAILAAPMSIEVQAGGKTQPLSAEPLTVQSAAPHEVRTRAQFAAGPLSATVASIWDYDGTVRVELTLDSTNGQTLDALDLVIPFTADSATLIHANADRIRAPVAQRIPDGNGIVWDAAKVACDDFAPNFCPYVYLGTPVRGLCWFAENDSGWARDGKRPNVDVSREQDRVVLRVHLVNSAVVVDTPRTIVFGLLAAPVKPRLSPWGRHGWRYRYLRDRYSLLGTDINWLSIGTCGSFYPAGKDLYLWEMLARGNREQLSTETIQGVADWGRRYFEPYGEGRIESWVRHVHHNLRSRYGTKMVFYYNRASHQACEEFETFKDEWCLTDLRSIGKGPGIGEIKVVPSASYIDFNLYWYARSFETGNNQGVYWDNWFIAPSFNTEMTAAYAREDGAIVPAAGVWGLRELAKRTFVMMNERGILPITFPHMTSFNPLPMMSFATVQYDWEWKYSLGDVQDRHTRELIMLMSTGELAGVWPVPLGDHGKLADDLWTQRTFTAVRLVHELDGYAGCGHGWQKSHQQNRKLLEPILALLDEPELNVYRYWDERPQPVRATHPDVHTIVYAVPGRTSVVAVVSYAPDDVQAELHVDAKALGFERGCSVIDVETDEALQLADGVARFPLKKHDIKVLQFRPME